MVGNIIGNEQSSLITLKTIQKSTFVYNSDVSAYLSDTTFTATEIAEIHNANLIAAFCAFGKESGNVTNFASVLDKFNFAKATGSYYTDLIINPLYEKFAKRILIHCNNSTSINEIHYQIRISSERYNAIDSSLKYYLMIYKL